MVEQEAVNFEVASSSLASRANQRVLRKEGFLIGSRRHSNWQPWQL